MFRVSPGTYNAYETDGSLITWGPDPLRYVVTTDDEIRLYIGDAEKPFNSAPLLRTTWTSREQFESSLRLLTQATLIHHVKDLVERLAAAIDLVAVTRKGKVDLTRSLINKRIEADVWEIMMDEYIAHEARTTAFIVGLREEILRLAPGSEITIEGL
jgi:hypothetical protein